MFGCIARRRLRSKGSIFSRWKEGRRWAFFTGAVEELSPRRTMCFHTARERDEGGGVGGGGWRGWRPRPALSYTEPPWLPCVMPVRSKASGIQISADLYPLFETDTSVRLLHMQYVYLVNIPLLFITTMIPLPDVVEYVSKLVNAMDL